MPMVMCQRALTINYLDVVVHLQMNILLLLLIIIISASVVGSLQDTQGN